MAGAQRRPVQRVWTPICDLTAGSSPPLIAKRPPKNVICDGQCRRRSGGERGRWHLRDPPWRSCRPQGVVAIGGRREAHRVDRFRQPSGSRRSSVSVRNATAMRSQLGRTRCGASTNKQSDVETSLPLAPKPLGAVGRGLPVRADSRTVPNESATQISPLVRSGPQTLLGQRHANSGPSRRACRCR